MGFPIFGSQELWNLTFYDIGMEGDSTFLALRSPADSPQLFPSQAERKAVYSTHLVPESAPALPSSIRPVAQSEYVETAYPDSMASAVARGEIMDAKELPESASTAIELPEAALDEGEKLATTSPPVRSLSTEMRPKKSQRFLQVSYDGIEPVALLKGITLCKGLYS